MRHCLIIIFIGLLFAGCAPKMGEIYTMPKLKSESVAEISIMRNYNFFGSAVRLYPTVDGKKIAGLYGKEYVRFHLEEGKHTFSIMFPDIVLGRWVEENKIEKNIEATKRYYFLLSPGIMAMEIEEITQEQGEKRISSSDLVLSGSISDQPDALGKVLLPAFKVIGLGEDDGQSSNE